MSPHTVNNFVSDLVDMAKAVEELPKVKEELEAEKHQVIRMAQSILTLEADLEQSKAYAASLEQKVRDAEVAKDSAETMFLEADERTSRALDFIKATFGNAGSLIQALEPVKVAPVEQGESASPLAPISNPDQYFSGALGDHGESHSGESVGVGQAPNSSPAQGQSEPDPIFGSATETASVLPSGAPTSDAGNTASWATSSPQPDTPPASAPEPYAGKYYIDIPGWVSREDWIAGGGTNETYDFRYGQSSF